MENIFYICLPCIIDYKYKSDAANDFISVRSSELFYVCTQCSGPFRLGYKLYNTSGIQEQQFSCMFGGKVSSSASSLEYRGYFNSKNSSRISRHSLENHMQSHKEERTFNYKFNNKRFQQKYDLKIPTDTDITGKLLSSKGCMHAKYLKRHMQLHAKEKLFPFEQCNKNFIQKQDFKIHMRIHTNEKPFPCEVCSKRFTHKHILKTHMRIHANEKPFPCEVCNRRFTHKHHLKSHMRIHTKEKPFPCEVCNKRFTQTQNLTRHTRIHLNEIPLKSKKYGERFMPRESLKYHIQGHTKSMLVKCTEADK